jgi:hypothetical protein
MNINECKNFECRKFKSVPNEGVLEFKSTLKFSCISIFDRQNLALCHILY